MVGPGKPVPCRRDGVRAERSAVGCGVVLLRGAVADVAADDDERRPVVLNSGRLDRLVEAAEVVHIVDAQHVPAVGIEPLATCSQNARSVEPSMEMWLSS